MPTAHLAEVTQTFTVRETVIAGRLTIKIFAVWTLADIDGIKLGGGGDKMSVARCMYSWKDRQNYEQLNLLVV